MIPPGSPLKRGAAEERAFERESIGKTLRLNCTKVDPGEYHDRRTSQPVDGTHVNQPLSSID